ncbi:hypothetical protein EDD17DRAFT_536733 [Pisolithus thermaeus]|nr:hypothetical protein EDD17DRAFT_536733 [Pisolithus thermaeus]
MTLPHSLHLVGFSLLILTIRPANSPHTPNLPVLSATSTFQRGSFFLHIDRLAETLHGVIHCATKITEENSQLPSCFYL